MDLKYFRDNKLISNKKYSAKERIVVLQSLFRVSSLTMLTKFNSSVSYRKAQDFLIDPKRYQAFLVKEAFSYDDICAFAKEMNLPPGIVAGHL